MSQFDFPRINFHGSVLLDTPTANNGYTDPFRVYNQTEAHVYLPPRIYLTDVQKAWVQINYPSFTVYDDGGEFYIEIATINNIDLLSQWSVVPIGTSSLDKAYWPIYKQVYPPNQLPLCPGYWNYYGDLSMSLNNVMVTGITIPSTTGGTETFTPADPGNCPSDLKPMLNAEFSFNKGFTNQNSQTSAYLCDLDSEGQLCTQIFYSEGGLYTTDAHGNKTALFVGKPCKSTARWMNLTRVLNWAAQVPMGGSASFYTTIPINDNYKGFKNILKNYTGVPVEAVFVKFIIHRVYEVRAPDYNKLPKKAIGANQTNVPKNPARAYITGTISPASATDLKTTSQSRILLTSNPVAIDQSNIPVAVQKDTNAELAIPSCINMAPVFFRCDLVNNLVSLDVSNTINEYGTTSGHLPLYAGTGDVPPFNDFDSYNFGQFDLYFQKDNSIISSLIGSFNYANNYNAQNFLNTGGMIDIPLKSFQNFLGGKFYLSLKGVTVLNEQDYFVTTDQQGTYAQQSKVPTSDYLSNGLPLGPCILNVYNRGEPVGKSNAVTVMMQNVMTGDVLQNISIYDGYQLSFQVKDSGCFTYAFITPNQSPFKGGGLPGFINFVMSNYLISNRILSVNSELDDYLSGAKPLTWDVVHRQIFYLYQGVYPVMNAVVPFNSNSWSDRGIVNMMKKFIDLNNWNEPMYMPVTRELSEPQRQLLIMWINKVNSTPVV